MWGGRVICCVFFRFFVLSPVIRAEIHSFPLLEPQLFTLSLAF